MIQNLHAFDTRPALMAAASANLADALSAAIARHGNACAALSGGSTPEPLYRQLAAMPLDWPRITFALVDERFVPPTHDASNEALVRRALAPAFAAGARFEPMFFAHVSASDSADRADAAYAALRIDVALMGMGEDGHTASWFAGSTDLGGALDMDSPRCVIAVHAAEAAGAAERLTLTRAALVRAGRVLLVITGAEKCARLEAALAQGDAPISALFNAQLPAPEVMWAA